MNLKKLWFTSFVGIIFALGQSTALASFGDVYQTHPNKDGIEYVQSKGIVNGYPNGAFRPNAPINRAEFTKIVVNALLGHHPFDYYPECFGLTEEENRQGKLGAWVLFSDVHEDDWFSIHICSAHHDGIIQGYPDGTFRPANNINLAEASKIIANSFGLMEQSPQVTQPWYKGYVEALAAKKAIPVSISGFDTLLTRGEMAEMIYRLQAGVTTKPSLAFENLVGVESQPQHVLLRKGNDLLLHAVGTREFQNVLYPGELQDFDLSEDGRYLAYSLRETGFEGNSDIYLKNMATNQTKRLTEKNLLTSSDPVIFSNNSRVAYVRRSYNSLTKTLSDGEIWVINADGNAESSFRIATSKNIQGLNSEADCVSEEEKKMVKLRIERISPDGGAVAYQQKDWAPECSGLWDELEVKKIDGSDFFSKRFHEQNMFEYHSEVWDESRFEWDVANIFWLSNGDFLVQNQAGAPLAFTSIYLYDSKQNLRQKIFDNSLEGPWGYGGYTTLLDVKQAADGSLLLVLQRWHNGMYQEYFTYRLRRDEKIDLERMMDQSTPFISHRISLDLRIGTVKILNDNTIVYGKQLNANNFELWSYNIQTGEHILLQGFVQELDFDLEKK